ncbi:MAG: hypothetical protein AB1716_08745 [Planctomycetota bacterium]
MSFVSFVVISVGWCENSPVERLVYQLYGLTEAEIRIVEEATQ